MVVLLLLCFSMPFSFLARDLGLDKAQNTRRKYGQKGMHIKRSSITCEKEATDTRLYLR